MAAANGNGEITQITLTAGEASALTGVGITTLQSMLQTAPPDPTFNYYTSPTDPTASTITIAANSKVAGLDPTTGPGLARIQAWNLDTTGRYVVLGIGPRSSMVGKTMASAPVHFGDQPVLNPEYGYQHLVAIFKVSTGNGTTAGPAASFTQAQLVGVAPVHDTGLGSVADELQTWYQATNGGS